jgi:hypothetical protein
MPLAGDKLGTATVIHPPVSYVQSLTGCILRCRGDRSRRRKQDHY